MTVSIVSLSARGENEIAVTFELCEGERAQRETFLISSARMADWQLCCGETSQACFDAVSHGAQVYRATKRGLYLLGYGTCSERALCQKLIAKGIARDVAREAVAELSCAGYLNEKADAAREAERCVTKEWGKRRIVAALHAKGFSDEAIKSAMNELEDAGVDYVELCVSRIRKQVGVVPSEPAEKQKLIASQMRCGFSLSEIKEAFSLIQENE